MNEYELALCFDSNIPQNSIVGEFFKKQDPDFKCFIILDDKNVIKHKMREMFVEKILIEDKTYQIVITEALLRNLQTQMKHFQFALYHELGHIHNGHFENNKLPEQYRNERLTAILEGKATGEELEADAFAVNYCGKNAAIRALDSMYKEREQLNKTLPNPNSDINIGALNEIEYRKKMIKKI